MSTKDIELRTETRRKRILLSRIAQPPSDRFAVAVVLTVGAVGLVALMAAVSFVIGAMR